VTGRPEVAEPTSVRAPAPKIAGASALKVIDCDCAVTDVVTSAGGDEPTTLCATTEAVYVSPAGTAGIVQLKIGPLSDVGVHESPFNIAV
jgi:hypothetical protein